MTMSHSRSKKTSTISAPGNGVAPLPMMYERVPGGFVEVRMLPSRTQRFVPLDSLGELDHYARGQSEQDVYFGVATRGTDGDGSAKNCQWLPALFVDIDFKTTTEEDARCALTRLAPTLVIASGGGLHAYWYLSEPIQAGLDAKSMLRRLALAVGGDLASAEPARILRLPGTFNHKYSPARLVRVEWFDPKRVYSLDAFAFLPAEPASKMAQAFAMPETITSGERNATLFRLARALHAKSIAEPEILAALVVANQTRCVPPLDDAEVGQIAHGAATQADSPSFTAKSGPNPWDALVTLRETTMKDRQPHWNAWLEAVAPYEPHERDALLTEGCKFFGTKRATADQALAKLVKDEPADEGAPRVKCQDPEPWPTPVDGAALAADVEATIKKYCVISTAGLVAAALWTLYTWVVDISDISPYFALTSPEPESGKTTTRTVMSKLSRRAVSAVNISTAALFRAMHHLHPTLFVDEADCFLALNLELKGILNAGHVRDDAGVLRTEGESFDLKEFNVFGPKLVSCIGKLPWDTLARRSIEVRIDRKTSDEVVERLRRAFLKVETAPLCQRAMRWAQDNFDALKQAVDAPDNDFPEELSDRGRDNWRPLFRIADSLGGEWPERARNAALRLSGRAIRRDDSIGVMLLGDLKTFFSKLTEKKKAPGSQVLDDRAHTEDVIRFLVTELPDRSWKTFHNAKSYKPEPITTGELADILEGYRVTPKQMKIRGVNRRGYFRAEVEKALKRYWTARREPVITEPSEPGDPLPPLPANDDAGLGQKTGPLPGPEVAGAKIGVTIEEQNEVAAVAVPEGYERNVHGVWFNPDTGTTFTPVNGHKVATVPARSAS